MQRFIGILLVILALWGVYSYNRIDWLKKENNALETQNKGLNDSFNRVEKDYVEISKRFRELEQEAKEDKTNFDWYYNISDSSVVKRLHKPYKGS